MNFRQKISLVFLILGLLFSSIIRVRFNISNGFEFHNIWITWIPSIFDFALLSTKEQDLTSTFLGYIFFAVFGILMLNQIKRPVNKNKNLTTYLGLTVFALLFELISLAQDLYTSYYGQHLRIGMLLFFFGIIVYYQTIHSLKFIGALHHK